jgi:hypothetical protein
MITTLSLADKVILNQLLAASIAGEINGNIKAAPAEKSKKQKDPNAPKKEAAPGVKAWNAFVKHCKATQPTLFTDIKLEKERLAICGGIKEKDLPAYQAWVAEFLKNLPASAPSTPATSDTEEAPVAAAKKPKKEKTAEQKAADSQKRKEKAAAKKATPVIPATIEEDDGEADGGMVKKEIKGKHYLMDPSSGNLYSTDAKGQSLGDYVGKFRAGDDATPIDFDAEE